ncbi:MAG: selenium cofactor biosynthesis protein YqeC [Desulfomonilaceae bacterium]
MRNDRHTDFLSLIEPARTVAIAGAGGKTTLMFYLARRYVEAGKTVITTTTTHIFVPSAAQSPLTILASMDPRLSTAAPALLKLKHVTIGLDVDAASGKLKGVDSRLIHRFRDLADVVIIEADGAAGRPIKAPEAWEPVIPPYVDLVIFVIGLDAVGQRVDEKTVFRLRRFCDITGLQDNEVITPDALVRLAYHSQGGLKGVPPHARFIVLLNKMDRLSNLQLLETIAAVFEKERPPRQGSRVVAASTITGEITVLKE